MEIISKSVNGVNFSFVCDGWSNSRAWGHLVVLLDGSGREVSRCKIRYYNRTWESWRFQSACRGAVDSLIESRRREAVEDYKERTGAKRLTEDKKKVIFAACPDLVTLGALRDSLRN